MPNLSNQLLELMRESSKELIKIYHTKHYSRVPLKIPLDSKEKELRISEQELRFTMTCLFKEVCYTGLTFSVETPTKKPGLYGKGKSAASTDVTIYYNDDQLNVELKANQPTPQAVDKDIKKLCKENIKGAWCHLFRNENKATVKKLFNKFTESIIEHFDSQNPKEISFHILILGSKTLLSKKGNRSEWRKFAEIHRQGDNDLSREWLKQKIFCLEYKQWKKLKGDTNYPNLGNGWLIRKY